MSVSYRIDGRNIKSGSIEGLHYKSTAVDSGSRRAGCSDHIGCSHVRISGADHRLNMVRSRTVSIHLHRTYIRAPLFPLYLVKSKLQPGQKIHISGLAQTIFPLEIADGILHIGSVKSSAHADSASKAKLPMTCITFTPSKP